MGDEKYADHLMEHLKSSIFRIVHADDVVTHGPLRGPNSFKHLGDEVWYPAMKHDGSYKFCPNQAGKPENDNCSHSLFIKTGVDSHLNYLGVPMGDYCIRKQPSGTLTEELVKSNLLSQE